jgi:hypothetical protein
MSELPPSLGWLSENMNSVAMENENVLSLLSRILALLIACLQNERSDFLPLNQWLCSAQVGLFTDLPTRSVHN